MITIEDFKIKHPNKVRFIGLDLGSKRIGVSICDERQSIATPFKTINKTNTNELIDEGVLLWFPAPNSYTGEDLAEFHVHGSRAVINAIHNTLSQIENCRLAEPGEFTKRAFQN